MRNVYHCAKCHRGVFWESAEQLADLLDQLVEDMRTRDVHAVNVCEPLITGTLDEDQMLSPERNVYCRACLGDAIASAFAKADTR